MGAKPCWPYAIDTPTGSRQIARTSTIWEAHPIPEKTNQSRPQDTRNAALALDQDTVLVIVAKLVEALKRSIPEGTQNAELKNEALRLARELLRGTRYEEEWTMGVDLRMEPYAGMFEKEHPESRIIDELCFPGIDRLCERIARQWYEHPDRVATQMQGISKGRAPRMEGEIGHLADPRPWLVLK
jgi:hypothetical protein